MKWTPMFRVQITTAACAMFCAPYPEDNKVREATMRREDTTDW
jgi:hypothetical protein